MYLRKQEKWHKRVRDLSPDGRLYFSKISLLSRREREREFMTIVVVCYIY